MGRDRELDALADFVGCAGPLPAVLLFEGEAGIGKTTLWRAGVELAGDRFRVLDRWLRVPTTGRERPHHVVHAA